MFSILRWLFLLLVYGLSLGAASVYFAIQMLNEDLPGDLSRLVDYQPSRKSTVISTDGEEIGTFSIENRRVVPLDRMPPHVPAAFISAEDRRFWVHPGFDVIGIARAAIKNFSSSDVKEGASTLTQQIIKQTILADEEKIPEGVFSPDEFRKLARLNKYQRKMKELILAVRVERELTKAEILSIYLNHIYLGHGAYGVGAAAETYFGKDVENLTIAEAALLGGLVAAPNKYAPHHNFELARERQLKVLDHMREDGYISDTEYQSALVEPIALVQEGDLNHLAAPYFIENLRQLATKTFGNRNLFRGGLRFYSTLDTRMQTAAEAALTHGLEVLDRRLGFRGSVGTVAPADRAAWLAGPPSVYRASSSSQIAAPTSPPAHSAAVAPALASLDLDTVYNAMLVEFPRGGGIRLAIGNARVPLLVSDVNDVRNFRDDKGHVVGIGDLLPVRLAPDRSNAAIAQTPTLQGALVAMEPHTGRVVAMVGGYDWNSSQLNRATQAHRQVGSAIKPFIYGTAIAAGHTELDRFDDYPVAVPTATGIWSPSNYDGQYAGWVTIRTAIARSLNTISVQLLLDVGLDRVIDTLRGFGIVSTIPRHVSISLGTPDFTLYELVGAYAGIANGGRRVTPRVYDVVTDSAGKIVDDLRHQAPGPQIFSPDVTYVLTDLMKGVVARGTAMGALPLGRPTAGKTGTSAGFKNVWFVGFTTDLLCGVWVGRDDNTPIGNKITGGGAAVPIWLDFMQHAHPPTPVRDFPVPPGVTFARADGESGEPTGAGGNGQWIPFARGTMPARFAPRDAVSFGTQVPAPPSP